MPERAQGSHTGHAQWRLQAEGSEVFLRAAAPAPSLLPLPYPVLPSSGTVAPASPQTPEALGLSARRRRGRAGRRTVMWRTLCALRQDTRWDAAALSSPLGSCSHDGSLRVEPL